MKITSLDRRLAGKGLSSLLWLVFLSGIPGLAVQSGNQRPEVFPLKLGWTFQEVGGSKWYPATVPGCVHTDLLNNRLIADPFYGDN